MGVIDARFFHTVYGRNLLASIPQIAGAPYLIVTMGDLWPKFRAQLETGAERLYLVDTLEAEHLDTALRNLPPVTSVVGLGGGMALDVAKYFAWRRNLPLFQVPTIMSVNAAFAHRSGIRFGGRVRYIGFKIPEVVYVDYDIIRGAPLPLNRAGVGDIFCIHTAHADWKLATRRGKAGIWPFDPELAAEAQEVLQATRAKAREIRNVTEEGIRAVMQAHRWTGATYHNAGWNPRYIEGCEHFFFYSLEHLTRRHFVHGEPVCLGIIFMSHLQENDPEGIWESIEDVGVRVRPEDMGVTWDDVAAALRRTRAYVEAEGWFYTTINERDVPDALIEHVRERLSQGASGDSG
ncbi:MAG: iron-containing alcohol dehydrogenase [Anaerolineae bacterium]